MTAAERLAAMRAALGCGDLSCPCARADGNVHCPSHRDDRPSLSLKLANDTVLVHCHAGCPQDAVLAALRERGLWPAAGERHDDPAGPSATAQHPGLTVEQYATVKRLDPDRLRTWGVTDGRYQRRPALRLAYLDRDGREVAVRYRLRLDKGEDDDRFRWKKGSKAVPYGQQRLAIARERDYVVLVEGESDCHTLWQQGEPALGLPGAGCWRHARDTSLLDGIATIYLVVEPDDAGESLLDRFATSSLVDRVRVIRLGDAKDPSGLYLADPAAFPEAWEAARAAAPALSDLLAERANAEAARAWAACQDLANQPDILIQAADTVAALGVAGETAAVKLVFLSMTSRLLPRPVSLAVKGPSSAGKSHLVEQTLRLFPAEAFYALTAMSERSLAYSDEPLSHRMLVVYEAAGLASEMASYLMRSLLSEGRLAYETVIKTAEGLEARRITREGPTGLIVTTTAVSLHPENETRLVSIPVSDSREQTKAILIALAHGPRAIPDLAPWHALQQWLASGPNEVVIPFAPVLARLIPPAAVRLRRDFGVLLTLIRSHALLQRARRNLDADGRIIATLDDYTAVRDLFEPLLAGAVEASVPPTVRETVVAVAGLLAGKDVEATCSVTEIAKTLKLDKAPASRRVRAAIERGYLVNREERKGRPSRIALGDPMPEDAPVLPECCAVAHEMEEITDSPPAADNGEMPDGLAEAPDEVRAIIAELRQMSEAELDRWRREVAEAPPDDPEAERDRQALSWFDRKRSAPRSGS